MSTMIPQTRSVPGGCALLVHFSSTDLGEHCRKHKTPQRELGLSRDEVGGRVARFVVVMLFSRKQSKSVTIIPGSWFLYCMLILNWNPHILTLVYLADQRLMARLFSPKIDVYHWELLKRLCHDDHKESLEMAIIKKIIGLNTRALPGFWEHLVPHPLPKLWLTFHELSLFFTASCTRSTARENTTMNIQADWYPMLNHLYVMHCIEGSTLKHLCMRLYIFNKYSVCRVKKKTFLHVPHMAVGDSHLSPMAYHWSVITSELCIGPRLSTHLPWPMLGQHLNFLWCVLICFLESPVIWHKMKF